MLDLFKDLHFNKTSYSSMVAYSNSKLANVLFTTELSRRLSSTQISVNSLHPGAVMTDLTRHLPQWMQSKVCKNSDASCTYVCEYIIWLLCELLQTIMSIAQYVILKSPVEGSQTQICVAVDPTWERVSGLYFSDCWPKEPSEDSQNKDLAARLWTESERLVGEKFLSK